MKLPFLPNIPVFAAIALATTALAAPTPDAGVLAELPVQSGGRKKPFSTFAREAMLAVHGGVDYQRNKEAHRLDALAAISSLWFAPSGWEHELFIRVGLESFRDSVGLDPNRSHFSFRELIDNARVMGALDDVREKQRRETKPHLTHDEREASALAVRLSTFLALRNGSAFTCVPGHLFPGNPHASQWVTVAELKMAVPDGDHAAVWREWEALRGAWADGDSKTFATTAARFTAALRSAGGTDYPPASLISLERLYTTLQPHRIAWMVYAAAAFVLLFIARLPRGPAYVLAWLLMCGGLALQIFGFYCRVTVAGRPPVTNMYETVIWVGFGVVFFAMILEAVHRNRYFLLGAAPAALLSLYLADTQPVILDPTINPLQPVLRDNFWLATHVIAVVSSYAAFLLALALGHIALVKVMFGRSLDAARPLYQSVYRAMQIGVLLLATGVVLGAFWANYSWGRFWDWDPKETWALVALLCYLFILHGRIAGWWNGFGLSVGAVLAFQAVLMAWYGVNFVLGTGMHSYGFGSGGLGYAIGFVIFELVFVAAAIARAATLKRALIDAPVRKSRELPV